MLIFQVVKQIMPYMENDDKRVLSLKQWFALYTTSRAEKKVAVRLASIGVEYFLPLLRVRRKWSDRVKIVEIPLFSSYIFVKVKNSELPLMNKIDGVVKSIYYNGNPAVMKDKEIEVICEYIQKAGDCELIAGDTVEIVCGSLVASDKLVTGKIIRVKKNYLYLYIEQLRAGVCVKKCEVKKIKTE